MRIVITDCDHDAFDEERAVVEASGDELIIANATDPAALIANARGADALVVQYASITAEILDALPQVKVVSRYGVGVDSVDIPATTTRGVAVCTTMSSRGVRMHDAANTRSPSICTRQARQLPSGR